MEEQKLLKRKRKAISECDQKHLAAVTIDLAEFYFREGIYEKALTEYKEVAILYKEMGNMLDYARANRMIGETYTNLRQYEKALRCQQIYYEVSKKENDKLEQQRALATIGHTYLTIYLDIVDNPDKSSLNLAYKSFMKSLVICESLTGIGKREHMDMTARLLANLGIVQECIGNYDKGIELLQKSINICKTNDLFEQLERGHSFLGSLYVKKGESSQAIRQYNLAIEVAERLEEKDKLIGASLLAKSEILINLADFQGAKTVLLKAFKLKNCNDDVHKQIERNLKVITAMCIAEDSLLMVGENDYGKKKELYEKMGDGACYLRNYPKAIEYYRKMLDAAVSLGLRDKDLSPCYQSLAQTYCDNKQYEESLEYFRKDYEIWRSNVADALSNLFSICDMMDLAGKNFEDVKKIYYQGIEECRKNPDVRYLGKTLIRLMNHMKNKNEFSEIPALEEELRMLNYEPSESESEDSQVPNIGDDISIEDITDISDEEESESRRPVRKRMKGLIRRNNKGETQLHTACIKGNVLLVQKLLNQNHPVNVRDNCGWLPLHEACLHGHIEIVKMLLDKGASINDRGGTQCNGMTPLHDSASNGHLEIIQLLLDRGASPLAKTDDGEFPLHFLKSWRTSIMLDESQCDLYEALVDRMQKALQKAGHDLDKITVSNKENVPLVFETNPNADSILPKIRRPRRKSDEGTPLEKHNSSEGEVTTSSNLCKKSLETSTEIDDDSKVESSFKNYKTDGKENKIYEDKSDSECNSSDDSACSEENAGEDYAKVIHSLRRRTSFGLVSQKRKIRENKKNPLITGLDEDDWLEDDIATSKTKKSKLSSPFKKQLRKSVDNRTTTSPFDESPRNKNLSFDRNSLNENYFEIDSDEDENDPCQIIQEQEKKNRHEKFKHKRKRQINLLSMGFNKEQSKSPINNKNKAINKTVAEADSTVLTSATRNLTHPFLNTIDPVLTVDVRIDGKLFRVPVQQSELNNKTIKWLGEEASNRYCKKEFMKPKLELECKNGAALAEDDYLSILFPNGSLQAEEVLAKVLKWNLPPLIERYKEACVALNIPSDETIEKHLIEVTSNLHLSDSFVSSDFLMPVCKALNRQTNLQHLNLSGNFFGNDCLRLLCTSFVSLENLISLNLSLNSLNVESMKYLAGIFENSHKKILENLVSLDLSYNAISDESLKYLSVITNNLNLKSLSLVDVDFTAKIFKNFNNKNVTLNFSELEELNLSNNTLSEEEIKKFISWLNLEKIVSLDVSRNDIQTGLVYELSMMFLDKKTKFCLKNINLTECKVIDGEINSLLEILESSHDFECLNLSHNPNLTAVTLKRLLSSCSFRKLNLSGCVSILKGLEKFDVLQWVVPVEKNLQNIILYMEEDNVSAKNELVEMWRRKWPEKYSVNYVNGFLELFCK